MYPVPEEKQDQLTFVSHMFNVTDKDKIPSRIVVNSLAFLVGGYAFMQEAPDYYDSIEKAMADCSLQIVDSITKDFTILEIYQEP